MKLERWMLRTGLCVANWQIATNRALHCRLGSLAGQDSQSVHREACERSLETSHASADIQRRIDYQPATLGPRSSFHVADFLQIPDAMNEEM